MRAWVIQQKTGIKDLQRIEVPDPVPGPTELLISVELAGLNPADRYLAEDLYPANPPMPHVLGREGVGHILSVGREVTRFRVGQQVLILRGESGVTRWGTFAEQVTVDQRRLTTLPQRWTAEQSAGAPLVYLTAYQALTQWGELPPSVVLVSGASGGVGVATIQLGRALGHRVIGLSRSDDKARVLRKLGAAEVFDPNDPTWRKRVKAFLGEQRVDLAVDNIGGEVLPGMIDTLGMNGKISVVGQLAGPVPKFTPASLFFRRLRIGGVAVGTYSDEQAHAAWEMIVRLLDASNQRPVVDSVWPFEALPQAFERLSAGPMGKVLMAVGGGR